MLSRKIAKNICNCNKHISQMDTTIATDITSAKLEVAKRMLKVFLTALNILDICL